MSGASPQTDPERLKIAVEIWKHCVSVQMHFNEMEMKVRNLYAAILAASIGLVGVVQGKRIEISLIEMSLSASLLVVLVLIPVSLLFYFVDRHWYHRLLQGAVAQCIAIENLYQAELPEIQLGSKIKAASPAKFDGIWKVVFFFIPDQRFRRNNMLHSDQKIDVFYLSVVWGAAIVALVHGLLDGVRVSGRPPAAWAFDLVCSLWR